MNPTSRPTPPSIDELMTSYLRARSEGVGALADLGGEVEPFESNSGFRPDPNQTWTDAIEPLRLMRPDDSTAQRRPPRPWVNLISGTDALALPMCVGNYPQQVQDLNALLQTRDLSTLRPDGQRRPLDMASSEKSDDDMAEQFVQASMFRLAGEFDQAETMLADLESRLSAEWRDAWANEKAALLWEQGQHAEAERIWNELPESAPVLFNRGLAALFGGRKLKARQAFRKAIDSLPEEGGWHHLARLYLTLAEMK